MALFYGVQFLIRPWRFVRVVYNLLRDRPLSMFETTVHGLISNFVKGRRLHVAEIEGSVAKPARRPLQPQTVVPAQAETRLL